MNISECARCKHPDYNLKRCTGCYSVFYCSKTCQRADWYDHKTVCKLISFVPNVQSQSTSNNVDAEKTQNEELTSFNAESDIKSVSNDATKTVCSVCGKDAEKKCSRCKNVSYCSKQCQANDWNRHKQVCRKQQNDNEKQETPSFNQWFSPFSPFQQFFYGENLSLTATTTEEKFDKAILCARLRFPSRKIISSIDEIPSEYYLFVPHTLDVLVTFIPRYHHYRDRHCIYIQDKAGDETYVAFYLDYNNPFPFFNWRDVRPGRFIAIIDPCIHYFMDGSVGLRIEDPSQVSFIDV